ncbi:Translocation protein sec63 [Smittium mucronatum]|uniref:Translocation protein sec63 n=1 Tax=Smittium mucronatum TaxID=133383 RepID=A0A1R0H7A8_9FUNG|nr:Translocation protein sec63 [Smittium mucronatum]
MANYTYDESGVTFYFFALTILFVILVPSTIYILSSSAYQVKNTEISTGPLWDPYQILEVDTSADLDTIKKKFKKMSLRFHPDKVKSEDKDVAEAKYIEITKAYKTLTDDEARENYAKYGNPDGLLSRTMGIALPKLLVEARASPIVMSLYGIIIGFLLPFYVGRWWYNSSRYTKDGILNPTMITFFKNIREPISQLKQQAIIEKSIHLVHRGLIQISSAHGWSTCTLLLTNITQMLVQGVYEFASPISQLPYLDKQQIRDLSANQNLYGMHQVRRLSIEDKKDKLSVLGDKTDEVISLLDHYPQIEVSKTVLSVIGDANITPFSIVTLIVKIKILNPSTKNKAYDSGFGRISKALDELKDNDTDAIEDIYNMVSKVKKTQVEPPEVIAPYLAARKLSNWWFVFSNPLNARNVVPPVLISDLVTEKILAIQFQAPSSPGKFDFYVSIISDSYIGCDAQEHIRMVVVDPKILPSDSEFDDDISEPEESSFAAQMAEARGQSGAKGPKNSNDSSDEE